MIDTLLYKSDSKARSLVTDITLITTFAALVALSAQVVIPLPFTPVPITGQTLGILLTGSLLGVRRGFLALALYLVWGACGLHVFAGGAYGATRLFGATGGYLLAYPLATAVVGALAERGWDRKPARLLSMLLIGNLTIYIPGVLWLAAFVGGVGPAIAKGFVPFLIGDLLKLTAAMLLMPAGWTIVRKIKGEK
jgi:biotin transport system substrate-specific component